MASRAVTRRRVVAGAPVDGGAWRRVEAPFAAKLLPVARLLAPINARNVCFSAFCSKQTFNNLVIPFPLEPLLCNIKNTVGATGLLLLIFSSQLARLRRLIAFLLAIPTSITERLLKMHAKQFPEYPYSLAKRTSVFDDPTVEIQELTAVIKQDITGLNAAVVDLQLLSNSQNESGSMSTDTTTHTTTVVDNLKNRLMSTTKEFKEVLTIRTENLKVHENRRQLFSSNASKESTNPFIRQRPLATRAAASSSASVSPPPWVNNSASSSQLPLRNKADGESQPLLQQQQGQQQQQLAPLQDSYMQSRNQALHSVESTIHELSSIFTQLATMVSQQGELAIRIDENMEDTLANVEGAQGQLVRYFNSISSNRWLMIKIFLVLIVFLMIFLFFVA
nr:syntaxin-32-like [Ipomoea batatas]